jgi:hypothetical protein
MTPDLATVLEAIRAQRPAALEGGVELVGVVGSVARGEASDASDVDVVYRIAGRPTLMTLGAIMSALEDRLSARVDLVNLATVPEAVRGRMERDLVKA